jgi:GNAT superfamily N-acetyltransferase
VEIVPRQTQAHWRDFHHLPYRIYQDDPHWVPPLLLERKLHFAPKHNPYFEHARAAVWLAYQNGEPVGRISAHIDQLHLDRHSDRTGHFGFIEAVDDAGVFRELLRTAENWLRDAGLVRAVGPVSFSLWDQVGLLVEGFDTPPYVMMGHARPYFATHLEAAGYRGVQDLLAYTYGPETALPPVAMRVLARAQKRGDLHVRSIRMDRRHFDDEIALILDILNDAWSDNWGFVPMTPAEITDLAGILKFLLRPGDVAIAEYRGKAAAFAIIFPNLNEAIRDLRGRLAPFGWARLLWRLKVRGTRTARMPLMGVRKSLQTSPVGAALALSVIQATRSFNFERGVERSELSWVLDGNERVKHIIQLVGAKPYKRYRVYERAL